MLKTETLVLSPFQTNTYIVYDDTNSAIIIDPADSFAVIKEKLNSLSLTPELIFLTHGHFDHLGACRELKEEYSIPIFIHEKDAPIVTSPLLNASRILLEYDIISPPVDKVLKDGDKITFGNSELTLMHTPGHTRGSSCLIGENEIFSGDTVFAGGYGRYDLEGGDASALFKSLKKVLSLDENLTVYSGHGEKTTIKREKMTYGF